MSTLYKYSALPDRAPLRWPNDARIAVIFTINIEHWDMTHESDVPLYAGGPSAVPYELPGTVPDYANFSWREYGQRVGIWRLIEVFDKAGVPTTCTINGRTALDRARIVDAVNERGWEILAHNFVQTQMLNELSGDPDGERDVIKRTLDAYADVIGRPAKGWLSSSMRSTHETPHILKELGLDFIACYLNDDQPYPLETRHGPLLAIPYSNDLNDYRMFSRCGMSTEGALGMMREGFDQMYLEGAESGRILNVGMHPHVMGQAWAIRAIREFVDHVKNTENVWFPKREDIADWYIKNCMEHIS
jgi:peptidoglycan/xylan/chitin deacetylase (PgdA/CDA1 family)